MFINNQTLGPGKTKTTKNKRDLGYAKSTMTAICAAIKQQCSRYIRIELFIQECNAFCLVLEKSLVIHSAVHVIMKRKQTTAKRHDGQTVKSPRIWMSP